MLSGVSGSALRFLDVVGQLCSKLGDTVSSGSSSSSLFPPSLGLEIRLAEILSVDKGARAWQSLSSQS